VSLSLSRYFGLMVIDGDEVGGVGVFDVADEATGLGSAAAELFAHNPVTVKTKTVTTIRQVDQLKFISLIPCLWHYWHY